MSSHPPPVPPEQRRDEEPSRSTGRDIKVHAKQEHKIARQDPKSSQSAALAQNTRNQGYKQDR